MPIEPTLINKKNQSVTKPTTWYFAFKVVNMPRELFNTKTVKFKWLKYQTGTDCLSKSAQSEIKEALFFSTLAFRQSFLPRPDKSQGKDSAALLRVQFKGCPSSKM